MSENFLRRESSNTASNGARVKILEEPLIAVTEYSIQWMDDRVDLGELAKLRYIEGWSRERLAKHYQKSRNAITNYCQNIRKKNFMLPGLSAQESEAMRNSYRFRS